MNYLIANCSDCRKSPVSIVPNRDWAKISFLIWRNLIMVRDICFNHNEYERKRKNFLFKFRCSAAFPIYIVFMPLTVFISIRWTFQNQFSFGWFYSELFNPLLLLLLFYYDIMWHPSYYLIIMREFHRLMSRIVRVCSTQHVSISGENFLVSSVIFEQFNRWLIITRNSYVNNESDTRSNRLNNTSVPYLLLNTFISHLKLIQIEISIPFVFFFQYLDDSTSF